MSGAPSAVVQRLKDLHVRVGDPKDLDILNARESESLLPLLDWLCHAPLSEETRIAPEDGARCVCVGGRGGLMYTHLESVL